MDSEGITDRTGAHACKDHGDEALLGDAVFFDEV